jgi:uncharacterized protein
MPNYNEQEKPASSPASVDPNMSGSTDQQNFQAQSSSSGQNQSKEGMSEAHGHGARGTAAMDPETRQEVARKGGLAVSRNRQHMAEIGRKGGQSVSRNREHMAKIGRKGGAASRGNKPSEP